MFKKPSMRFDKRFYRDYKKDHYTSENKLITSIVNYYFCKKKSDGNHRSETDKYLLLECLTSKLRFLSL